MSVAVCGAAIVRVSWVCVRCVEMCAALRVAGSVKNVDAPCVRIV